MYQVRLPNSGEHLQCWSCSLSALCLCQARGPRFSTASTVQASELQGGGMGTLEIMHYFASSMTG